MAGIGAGVVGAGSLIGIGAIVLNAAVIGRNSLVAAGAFVPEGRSYPERSMIMGAPAKVTRELTDDEVTGLLRIAQGYVERVKIFREQLVVID